MQFKTVLFLTFICFLFISCGDSISKKDYKTPEALWPDLFEDVMACNCISDPKIFADAIPKSDAKEILLKYAKEKTEKGFDMNAFLNENFDLPKYTTEFSPSKLTFNNFVDSSFNALIRKPHDDGASLIPTRKKYFAGGGNFNEFNYFRSLFQLEALLRLGNDTMAVDLATNCAQFIQDFSYVPSGNRSYYLGRSNPPVLSIMVDILSKNDPNILQSYASHLTKEYQYWMSALDKEQAKSQAESQKAGKLTYKNVVFLSGGNILNRYNDEKNGPRSNKYKDDIKYLSDAVMLNNQRLMDESEWGDEARWSIGDKLKLSEILPVDLNAWLYYLEFTLSKIYTFSGQKEYAKSFENLAQKRKVLFNEYFWNEEKGFYFDYYFSKKQQGEVYTLAGVLPLVVGLANEQQATKVSDNLKYKFLKSGGLLNTLGGNNDGSSEYQYLAIKALQKYQKQDLAKEIATRWLNTNEAYYKGKGKIQNTYDVVGPKQKNPRTERIDGSLSVLLLLIND
jgi:alpha,alpha-trehalase